MPVDPNGLIDWDVADKQLAEALKQPMAQAIARTVSFVGTSVNVPGLSGLPVWQRVLVSRIARLTKGTDENGNVKFAGWNQSLRTDVAEALAKGYAAGEDAGSLALRMQKVLGVDPANPKAIGVRAEMIARTEAVGLSNDVSYRSMESSGVVQGKAWYSISDSRSRPSHVAAASKYGMSSPLPLNAKFVVGGVLMDHPHDTSAPAREVVQCRCRLLPVVKPD